MIFWIEAAILCALFTAAVAYSVQKDPLNWISDYPPAIQQRAMELGLIPPGKKCITKPELIRKVGTSVLLVVILATGLVYLNGAETFWQGFFWSYALYTVVDWYDAFVVDCLWFCHNPRVVLPGTEDLQDAYHDYGFHMKRSLLGMALGLPICLLVGALVPVLA